MGAASEDRLEYFRFFVWSVTLLHGLVPEVESKSESESESESASESESESESESASEPESEAGGLYSSASGKFPPSSFSLACKAHKYPLASRVDRARFSLDCFSFNVMMRMIIHDLPFLHRQVCRKAQHLERCYLNFFKRLAT